MKTLSITSNAKTVGNQVKDFVSKAKSIRSALPYVMANLILCAVKHGNVTPATQLIEGMKDTRIFRANDITEWLETNGPFIWNQEDGAFTLNKDVKQKLAKLLKDEQAEQQFGQRVVENFELKQEKPYNGFNFEQKLQALVKQAAKIENDGALMGHEKTNLTGLDQARQLLVLLATNDDIDGENGGNLLELEANAA